MRPQKVQDPYLLNAARSMASGAAGQSAIHRIFDSTQGATQQVITRIYDHTTGPLPLSEVSLITAGGPLLIYCSGSGRAPDAASGRSIGVDIRLDHRSVGQLRAETRRQDPTFLSGRFQVGDVPPGVHKIHLEAAPGTATHGADLFHLVVVEFRPRPGHHRFQG